MVFSEYIERLKPFASKIFSGIFLGLNLFWVSCGNLKEEASHQRGEMTIYADPSNKSLLEALTQIYTMKYPEVEFELIYKPESQILKDLQDTIAVAAFINQPLSDQQTKYIAQQTDVTPRSTLLAYDAAIFITSVDNPIDSITLDQIRTGILEGGSQIIFDDGNSGNFNTVRNVLNLEIPQGKSIQAEENAQKVIEFVQKSPKSVGVIGMNEISEKDNPETKKLLQNIKILSVIDANGTLQKPEVPNILAMNYPFFKGVYFIVREPGFGIGSGFSRFAGSNQGQLIVKREGLQPNFLYNREVQINLESVE